MTRAERKEQARIRNEARIEGYKDSVRKYVERVAPTFEKGLLHIQDCARNEIRRAPQMKEEIERCQSEAAKWFATEYGDKLESQAVLNEKQIENWRLILCNMGFGPWAIIMPAKDVEMLRDIIQKKINNLS